MAGGVDGGVRVLLRIEGLCVFAAALFVYSNSGAGWGTFALFFLAPDLSFFGYLAGPRVGAASYNAAHSYVGAIGCLVASHVFALPALTTVGLIWVAHIGFDRALGYGLKYAAGFGYTHLGRIGREAAAARSSA